MNSTSQFCSVLRKRSEEHAVAIDRLVDLPGMMASILRQELDSMVRAIYLLSIDDLDIRENLIEQTLKGEVWTELTAKGKHKKVTDRDMVELANELQGWTLSVYKFGCSFIHFSNFHNYSNVNPFDLLESAQQVNILEHMRYYHGGPQSNMPSFNELARYFPSVFRKIADNLECYIKDLELNKITDAP